MTHKMIKYVKELTKFDCRHNWLQTEADPRVDLDPHPPLLYHNADVWRVSERVEIHKYYFQKSSKLLFNMNIKIHKANV